MSPDVFIPYQRNNVYIPINKKGHQHLHMFTMSGGLWSGSGPHPAMHSLLFSYVFSLVFFLERRCWHFSQRRHLSFKSSFGFLPDMMRPFFWGGVDLNNNWVLNGTQINPKKYAPLLYITKMTKPNDHRFPVFLMCVYPMNCLGFCLLMMSQS